MMKTIGMVCRELGLQRTSGESIKSLGSCQEFSCTNGKYFVSVLVQIVLESPALEKQWAALLAPKLALPGSKISSVSSGRKKKKLLGLNMGYDPDQLDQWVGRCWLGWHLQGGGLECFIRLGGLGSQGGQKRGPHCCCYSCDGLKHRALGCWGR